MARSLNTKVKPGRTRLSKADGYLNRIFTVEYDLKAMLDAYGADMIHQLIDLILDGKINTRQDVDRWAATRSLYDALEDIKDVA